MAISALKEMGNIMASSYLVAIGDMTGLKLLSSPPEILADMTAAIVSTITAELVQDEDSVLTIITENLPRDRFGAWLFHLHTGGRQPRQTPRGPRIGGNMMADSLMVGMAEVKTNVKPDDILMALGLGSCVGICAFDPQTGIAGLAHVVFAGQRGERGNAG